MVAFQSGKLMSKCEWRSYWDEDYRCRAAAEEGSKFCIFHEPGEKDIERFKQAFYSQIREKGPADERNPKYDFRGYVFPTGLTVQGEEAELILPREIGETLIMLDSTIEGDADFTGAKIGGTAFFTHAKIKGDADFRGTEIGGTAFFTDAKIKGDADFMDAEIGGTAFFKNAEFWGAKFNGTEASAIYLGEGKPTILWWERNREGVTFFAGKDSAMENRFGRHSFWSFARRTFAKMEERERADAAYYFEKVWQRRSRLASLGRERLMAIAGYPFEVLFLRLPIAYGTSLVRPLMSWFVVIVLFGGLYAGFPSLIGRTVKSVWTLSNWVISMHFSVTTFTTLGLGDIHPGRLLGKALTSIEAVVGGVLMALTVVVISRKLMR